MIINPKTYNICSRILVIVFVILGCIIRHSARSPINNLYAKLQQSRFKQTIVSARDGGIVEATKRLYVTYRI